MHVEPLQKIVVEAGRKPDAALIWLHGLGANGHDFEPVVPLLGLDRDLKIRFIFPHAPAIPVGINAGYIMPAWYDIRSGIQGPIHDRKGILRSAKQIRMLIEQQEMHDIPSRRIILAGFSQGAAMALYCGLSRSRPLAGIIALSGYLPFPGRMREELHEEGASVPIFMAHGTEDPVVPFDAGLRARRELEAEGCRIEWREYPIEHRVCDEELRDVGRWINRILKSHA